MVGLCRWECHSFTGNCEVMISEERFVLSSTISSKSLASLALSGDTPKSSSIRFSIDDFGTGFSSLSTIQKVPLSELKIDQSFIQNISHEADSGVIIRTIIGMANNLGLDVVAEGVETQAQFTFLRQVGAGFFKGISLENPYPFQRLNACPKRLARYSLRKVSSTLTSVAFLAG